MTNALIRYTTHGIEYMIPVSKMTRKEFNAATRNPDHTGVAVVVQVGASKENTARGAMLFETIARGASAARAWGLRSLSSDFAEETVEVVS